MVISAILPAVVDHTRLVHLNLQDRQVRSDFKVHYFETHLRTCPTIRVVSDPAPRQRPGQAGVVGKGEVVLASVECAREGRKVSSSYTAHLQEKKLKEMKSLTHRGKALAARRLGQRSPSVRVRPLC